MTFSRSLLFSLAATSLLTSTLLAQSDNFDDNIIGQQWTKIQDDASLALAEQNQHLEAIANSPTNSNFDAIYLSNGPAGFLLSTAQDFEITIGYNFSAATLTGGTGSSIALVFGIGRDLDGTDSAAIGYGYVNDPNFGLTTALGASYRTDDIQQNVPLALGPSSGTFRLSYNAAGDDLTLGVGSSTYVLNNTIRGIWGADSLYTSFGARGSGFDVAAGNAVLDNFNVVSGVVLPVPEPSTNLLLALGVVAGAIVLRRRTQLSAQ